MAISTTRIENYLFGKLDRSLNDKLQKMAARVQTALNNLQGDFFRVLASMIIGVENAPDLGEFTPTWKPLNEKYLARKNSKGVDGFYLFRGQLQQSLLRSKATTTFGRPLVTVQAGSLGKVPSGGGFRGPNGQFTSAPAAGNFVLKIDLYPDVVENLNSSQSSDFEGEYTSPLIATRLTNYRGRRNRPILIPFMKWWLNVRARDAMARAARGA